jgi:hypothetical protein
MIYKHKNRSLLRFDAADFGKQSTTFRTVSAFIFKTKQPTLLGLLSLEYENTDMHQQNWGKYLLNDTA